MNEQNSPQQGLSEDFSKRFPEYRAASVAAFTYANCPLSPDETRYYKAFVTSLRDLVDEEHPPSFIQMGSPEADKDEIELLMFSIKSYRLKRLFLQMAPEQALRVADTVARFGTDRLFFK